MKKSIKDRIVRDLHDELLPTIRAALFSVEYMESLSKKKIPAEYKKELSRLNNILQNCIRDIKNIICELNPPMIIEKKLIPAIVYYLERVKENYGMDYELKSDVSHNFSCEDEVEVLKNFLKRLNILKDSGIKKIEVHIIKEADGLSIIIK